MLKLSCFVIILAIITGCLPEFQSNNKVFESIIGDTIIDGVSEAFRTYRKTSLGFGYRESQIINSGVLWARIRLGVDYLQVGWDDRGIVDGVSYKVPDIVQNARSLAIFNSQRLAISRVINSFDGKGRVWEIGNEPNLYPYKDPEAAAGLVNIYTDYIMGLDQTAKIMHGGLFILEGYPGIRRIIAVVDSNVITETSVYLDSLLTECKVDIGNIHIYPMGMVVGEGLMRSLREIADVYTKHGVTEIWVTEIGNANPYLSEEAVVEGMDYLIKMLACNTIGITRWYWYKASGYDHKFDGIKGMPPPVTALEVDGELTEIGKKYRQLHKTLR